VEALNRGSNLVAHPSLWRAHRPDGGILGEPIAKPATLAGFVLIQVGCTRACGWEGGAAVNLYSIQDLKFIRDLKVNHFCLVY